MEEEKQPEKQCLSEEELKEFEGKRPYELEKQYFPSDKLERMKNSIDKLEAEFKSVKGLKSFIGTGVLVSPHMILSANPDEHGFDMNMVFDSNGRIRVWTRNQLCCSCASQSGRCGKAH